MVDTDTAARPSTSQRLDGLRRRLDGIHRRFDDLGHRLDSFRQRIDAWRISEHLRRAERDLRASSPPGLDDRQYRRRERNLDHLRDYWQSGEFPTNRQVSGRTPCFVGANGVPCAMAHLLLADDREDLVSEVMTTDPTLRLEDVEEGQLVEWVEANGLTMDEAARIQPSYFEAVRFATDCGPVACQVAMGLSSLVGLAVAAGSEYVGYRLASDLFPGNTLKRRATLGYLTVLNLFLVPLVALLAFAVFP